MMTDAALAQKWEDNERSWLARNTAHCDKLQVTMRPELCGLQRQRTPFICNGCEGLGATKGNEDMSKRKCNEKGCTKWEVKGGKCSAHFRAKHGYSATSKKAAAPATPPHSEPVEKQKDPAEILPPNSPAAPASKSGLMDMLGAVAEQPPGFYLDFTNNVPLLHRLEEITEDLNAEVIELLNLLVQGNLCRKAK